jgi:diguanylate cyclase (GGDEF)-like protein/PAS domain S-box-containing protein
VVPSSGLADVAELILAIQRGKTAHHKGLVRQADGCERWMEVTAEPIFHADGTFAGSVGTARDVHEEVIAREELAESEAHYRLLADNASDVVAKLGPDRRITWVSPSVTTLLGWLPNDLIGESGDKFLDPADEERLEEIRQRTFDPVHPVAAEQPMVARIKCKGGGERWMSGRQQIVTDDVGHLVAVVVGLTDVDDLVHARETAQHDRARVRAVLDTMMEPHVLFEAVRDESGSVLDFVHVEVNEAACAYNHMRSDELMGSRLTDTAGGELGQRLLKMYRQVVATGHPVVVDDAAFPDRSRDTAQRYFDLRIVKVGDGVSVAWRDVTDRHDFEERLAHLATHDPLTGLANRAALIDDLNRALHAGRRAGRATAVLMMDLDYFKYVNDALGHAVGDQLLRSAGERLMAEVRAGDLVARLGGDEFIVVMRDLADPEEAFRMGLRIVESFRAPLIADGHDLTATASLGIAISLEGSTAEQLLREADTAMYRAKGNGRDRAATYNEDLRVAADARHTLEEQLRPALDLGELVVFFQPEVDLSTGQVCGVEALLRWQHQSGELYSADRFIDLAEETGLIVDIGRWAAREACRRFAAWTARYPGRLRTLYLNLSKGQLADPGLVDDFESLLAGSGVAPGLVCVEIAEPALTHATTMAKSNLARLRSIGLRLAIDDFGSGDAALAHLREHRVDAVKIDRSFVHDVDENDYARRLVSGITALAQRLGLAVVAEGVETEEQAAHLREMGCNSAHGFLYAGALPAAEITPLLTRTFTIG